MVPTNAAHDVADVPNHPLAVRMAIIAGISFNIIIGTVMGHFGVMLESVEHRLGIPAEKAAAGIPLTMLGAAVVAPIVGVLIARFSLRLILLIGALLAAAGFVILALTTSYALYLFAFGACFGPAMTLAGSIGPGTVVARWFNRNRGLALGLVNLAILIAIMPVGLNIFVDRFGAVAAYWLLAALCGVVLAPLTLLVIDHPPGGETLAPEPAADRTADGSFSTGQLLGKPRFWAMCLAAIASMTSSVLLGSLLVPMGVAWGFTRDQSALLASVMSLVGIAGGILFGWVSDRIGGARTLALIGLNCAILWSTLLLAPSFPVVALVVGLIGLHGAAPVPALGKAISDAFGQASFSRGFGLNTVISLPFLAGAIIGSARAYSATGSYNLAIIAITCFFAVAAVLGLYAAGGMKATRATAPSLA